ncbi:hypothetical protein STCU_07600 [Strigomonas culicis]|uniref:Uncharacterized protein n=1 Tax=Strigomonas culicis TaxID=28005 RepID=S9VKB6_9TRYP|nr:hypothetical protein STCU_07600 [Strigomonas culicis]|eukprot:EPY23640.1 hypothetical protein STCU_07600 [Strigomonas culicis]
MNQARRHAKKRVEPMPQDTIFLSGTTAGNTPAATTASSREDLEERVAGREPTYESEACETPSMPTFLLPYGSEALHSDAYATMDDSARNKLRGHDGTIGPLPYITFQRFHIHDVQFGNDPRSQFYSLFSCPERKFFDMQCLRMFVRRYIVHTSQNNNPRQVSLRRFIVSRCNCPSVEDALLVSIAQEELLHLVKADREMRKKTEPQPSRAVREYRAPAGLFWNTGILYITRIPVHTFLVGGLECAMVCALIVYSVVTFQTCDYYVIYELLRTYLSLIIALGIVGLIAGIFTCTHAVRMSIPLSGAMSVLLARAICVSGGVICSAVAVTRILRGLSTRVYTDFLRIQRDRVCEYYVINSCSGFYTSCVNSSGSTTEGLICSHCLERGYELADLTGTCEYAITAQFERLIIPFIAFSAALLLLFCVDHYLHAKLFGLVRVIQRSQIYGA